MSDWIEDHCLWRNKWEPWANDPHFVYEDGNGLQYRWMNVATGARMVLIADGGWRNLERARFRLWAHYPGDDDVELTRLFERNTFNDGRYQTDPELRGSDLYVRVEASCVACVKGLLGLTPAEQAAPPAPSVTPDANLKPNFIEDLIQRGRARWV